MMMRCYACDRQASRFDWLIGQWVCDAADCAANKNNAQGIFDFDERGLARTSDPDTSQDAARKLDAAALERIVLEALERCGDLTSYQISVLTNIHWNSISPRMKPLEARGYIERTGDKRIVGKHKASEVWRITELGRAALRGGTPDQAAA